METTNDYRSASPQGATRDSLIEITKRINFHLATDRQLVIVEIKSTPEPIDELIAWGQRVREQASNA